MSGRMRTKLAAGIIAATALISAVALAQEPFSTSLEPAQRLINSFVAGDDVPAVVARSLGGRLLLRGKITDVYRRTTRGFARGNLTIEGFGAAAERLEIDFQNEYLIANLNGETLATVPDLICIVTEEEGEPVSTEVLHYGTRVAVLAVPAPAALKTAAALRDHHDLLVANCFAQAEALMCGNREQPDTGDPLGAHRAVPGNRPNSMILLEQLDPGTLGALIALYEHKTFVQSVLWDINAFDQWGVELGKQLADDILHECRGKPAARAHDASTTALIARYLAAREPGA